MAVTNYQLADFINITEILATFQNAGPNLGTPPNATYAGLAAAAFGPENTQVKNADPVSAQVIYSYDLDHSTPTNPIPPTAHITKITVQLQITTNELTAFFDANYDAPISGNIGRAIATVAANIDIRPLSVFNTPPPDVNAWITSPAAPYLVGVVSDSDTTAYGATATATATGTNVVLAQVVFDISTDPNGDFPLGFMDYATFIAQFTNWFTSFSHSATSSGNWFGVIAGTDNIDGTFSNGIDFAASNLTIVVEWNLPVTVQWTIDTPSLVLPDNIVEISRPDPGVSPDEDTELPEAVWVNETKIVPNDPWVVFWTHLRIRFHLPPDETNDPPLYIEVIGTQFSGRVALGTLSITTADLSGIYQLDDSVFTDTLYVHTGTTSTTSEVGIPAPFLVTYFVDDKETNVLHYNATRMRVSGQGSLQQIFQSLDYINTETLSTLTLRTSNNLSPLSLANFIDQQASLRVFTSASDEFMNVSQIIIFSRPFATGYPQ